MVSLVRQMTQLSEATLDSVLATVQSLKAVSEAFLPLGLC